MPATEFPLTEADFDRCRWEEAIADASEKEFSYSREFGKRSRDAVEAGDVAAAAVFTVLYVVTDVELRPDDTNEPFGPRFVMRSGRGSEPGDLTDGQLEILRRITPGVADPEMRARLGDLLWTVKRDHGLAKIAVDAYVESARACFDPHNWVRCEVRIRRAIRLAKSLRSTGAAEYDKAIAFTEEQLVQLDGTDPLFLSARLMELLQEFKKGDALKYAALAEKAARRAEAEGGFAWERARHYWLCAANWHRLAKDSSARDAALTALAETFVKQAEEAAAKPKEFTPHLTAAGNLERAVHALRKIGTPDSCTRADVLYLKLVDHQRLSVTEMIGFTETIDLTDDAKRAEEFVSGASLDEALQKLAFIVKPQSKAKLRETVKERYGKSPLMGFFSGTTLGTTGKVVARRPHYESSDEAKERATVAEMFTLAVLHQRVVANGYVLPAIHKIHWEHNVRLQDFFHIANSSSFVPHGREMVFAKGLKVDPIFKTKKERSRAPFLPV